eukprot:5115034-Pleurochrysis_carterae.AAC.2
MKHNHPWPGTLVEAILVAKMRGERQVRHAQLGPKGHLRAISDGFSDGGLGVCVCVCDCSAARRRAAASRCACTPRTTHACDVS